jgi:hypothetical protein
LKPFIIVGALAVLLGGCGTAHQTAKVATASPVTATPAEIGPICAADVQDIPFPPYHPTLFGMGRQAQLDTWTQIAQRNQAARQAARAHQPAYCSPDAPRHDQATSEPVEQSIVAQQRQGEALEQMQQDLWLQNQQLQWQLQAQQLQDFSMRSQPRLIMPTGGGAFMMLP